MYELTSLVNVLLSLYKYSSYHENIIKLFLNTTIISSVKSPV